MDLMIKFLEDNGENLREISLDHSVGSLNLAIAEFCPNLKSLSIGSLGYNDHIESTQKNFGRLSAIRRD